MKVILLVAGYATRLYPLTESFPKALLKVGDKPILDYIVDEVNTIFDVNEIIAVSNHRFYEIFQDWARTKNNQIPITVLDDGSTNNDNRLGAIGDILFAIEKGNINEDMMVIAGDNLFDFKLSDFYRFYLEKKAPCVCVKEMNDVELLHRFGVAELDNQDKIIGFEEKPKEPKSNIAVYAEYIYKKETIPLFYDYKKKGYPMDAPGHFLTYLHKVCDVYAYKFTGECYDIGTHESLAYVNELYRNRVN